MLVALRFVARRVAGRRVASANSLGLAFPAIWGRGAVVMSSKFLATKILHLMTIPPLPPCGALPGSGCQTLST